MIFLRFVFFVNEIWQNVTFLTKSWLRISKFCDQVFKFVWRSPKNLLWFSRPKVRHTYLNCTTRKISLFWYDFVKESCPNSSYRYPKRRNAKFRLNLRSRNRTSKIVSFNVFFCMMKKNQRWAKFYLFHILFFYYFIVLFFIYLMTQNFVYLFFIYFVASIFWNFILTKFWVTISFRRFGDRYDEFGYDSFTKSYQKSEIFLMVKFESVWQTLGRLNDDQQVATHRTNLTTWTQTFSTWK